MGPGSEESVVFRLIDGDRFLEHLKREQAIAAGFDKEYRDIIRDAHGLLVKHARNPALARIAVETLLRFRVGGLAGKIQQHYHPQPSVGELIRQGQMRAVQPRPTPFWADQQHTGACLDQFIRSDAQAAERKATDAVAKYIAQLKGQAGWTAGERRLLEDFNRSAGMILDMIPGISAAKGVIESFRKGEYFDGILHAALGAADIGLAVWVPARAAKAAKGVAPGTVAEVSEFRMIRVYHGTGSNRASRIVGNRLYPQQGFRPGRIDGAVYLAEDFETARFFAVTAPPTGNHLPRRFTVIEFTAPEDFIRRITRRELIGNARGVPFVDPGSSPYELILRGGNISEFNRALKEGIIQFRRIRIR